MCFCHRPKCARRGRLLVCRSGRIAPFRRSGAAHPHLASPASAGEVPERSGGDGGVHPPVCHSPRPEQKIEIFPIMIISVTRPNRGFPAFPRGSGDSRRARCKKKRLGRPVCLSRHIRGETAENREKRRRQRRKILERAINNGRPQAHRSCTPFRRGILKREGRRTCRGLAATRTGQRGRARRYNPATVSSISCATTASIAA